MCVYARAASMQARLLRAATPTSFRDELYRVNYHLTQIRRIGQWPTNIHTPMHAHIKRHIHCTYVLLPLLWRSLIEFACGLCFSEVGGIIFRLQLHTTEHMSEWLENLVCMGVPAKDVIASVKPDRSALAILSCGCTVHTHTLIRLLQAFNFLLLDVRAEYEQQRDGRLPLAMSLDPRLLVISSLWPVVTCFS
jgi:hypothetical protein